VSDFQTRLQSLLPEIMASPRLFPHQLNPEKGLALVIEAEEHFYSNAVFLDQRALGPGTQGAWIPLDVLWRYVNSAADQQSSPTHFIFHTGHCGSTLVSRLLDEVPNTLGLRQPLVLRTLATKHHAEPAAASELALMFRPIYQLLARRYSPQQQVVIKPTSMCNNLAAPLLDQHPANLGIGLFVKLEVYLANMLDKSEHADIDGFIGHRQTSLEKLIPGIELDTNTLSRAEKIAFSWLAEAAQLNHLVSGHLNSRVLLVDFDNFLADKACYLEKIFSHLNIDSQGNALNQALASPVFRTYSKQPDFRYTETNREAILNESRANNHEAISAGIQYTENLMKTHSVLGDIAVNLALD
jgi:hypothetical protein